MVTPTTASAAEATPELPGTLGMVRTVSATPQVVWRSWSDTGGGLEYLSSTVITLSVRRLPAPTSPGGCSNTELSTTTSWRLDGPARASCKGCWSGTCGRRHALRPQAHPTTSTGVPAGG